MSRAKRMTKQQKGVIVSYLEDHKELLGGKVNLRNLPIINSKWDELTAKLNSEETGSKKTVKQWKEAIGEFKTNIRRKAREIRFGFEGTGGGPPNKKKLTDIEERLLALMSNVTVVGVDLPEAGETLSPPPPECVTVIEEEVPITEENYVVVDNVLSPVSINTVPWSGRIPSLRPKRRQTTMRGTQNDFMKDLIKSNNNVASSLRELARSIKFAAKHK